MYASAGWEVNECLHPRLTDVNWQAIDNNPPLREAEDTLRHPRRSKSRRTSGSSSPAGGRRAPQFGRQARGPVRGGGPTRTLVGVVSANRAGFGFVRSDDLVESVFLPPREMAGLMHGDQVRITATQGGDGRWSGQVVEVLARGVGAFLGTVDIRGRAASVQSADRRLNLFCHVAAEHLNGAGQGSWVIARILKYPQDGGPGVARVERLLDPEKPVTLATEAAIAKLSLPRDFSAEALADAAQHGTVVDPAEAARRVDLRELPLVTIDGEDARDFDDAVFAEPNERGFRLIVAIADVSYYVREGTALDA